MREDSFTEAVGAGRRAFFHIRPSSPTRELSGGGLPQVYRAFGPERVGRLQRLTASVRTDSACVVRRWGKGWGEGEGVRGGVRGRS